MKLLTHKRIILIVLALAIFAAGFYTGARRDPGTTSRRHPTIPVPYSVTVQRYYDAETDTICWIFTKRLTDY